jgi:voltage-gated potassium channel
MVAVLEMRKRIFEIVESAKDADSVSNIYDTVMMLVIIVSIVPLAFKSSNGVFIVIDKVAAGVFTVDYILRILTEERRLILITA